MLISFEVTYIIRECNSTQSATSSRWVVSNITLYLWTWLNSILTQ